MKNLVVITALLMSSFAMAEGAAPAAPTTAPHETAAPVAKAVSATPDAKVAKNECKGKKGAALKKCLSKTM